MHSTRPSVHHPLFSRFPSHIACAHTHAHAGLPPPRNTIDHHPTPRSHILSATEGADGPRGNSPPTNGAQGVAGSWGGAHRNQVSRCMLMNSVINFTVHNIPPEWRLLRGALRCPASRAARDRVLPVVSAWVWGPGSLASPSPVPLGPSPAAHHVLSVVAALAIPGSGPPPVASLCSSRRELPGARLGRDCGPRAGHRSGWRAGRREGSPPGDDRAGQRSALHREERESTGRKINVSQNICEI